MNARSLINWVAEPSTIRGLIQLAGVIGITVSPANIIHIITIGGALVGLINMVKKDSSKW